MNERITTPCPTCGNQTLFVGSGGHLVCSWLKCDEPGVERAIQQLALRPSLAQIRALPRHTVTFSGYALSDPPFKYPAVLLQDVESIAPEGVQRTTPAEPETVAAVPNRG